MLDYQAKNWSSLIFRVRGTVLPAILPRLLTVLAFTVALAVYDRFFHVNELEKLPHQLLGLVLGFLVVLRTNTAYDRFWEGRKLWGGIVNSSRNLMRLAATWTPDAPALADLVVAYVLAVKQVLRRSTDLSEVAAWAPPTVVEEARKSASPPLVIAARLSAWIQTQFRAGRVDSILARQMDERVRELIDYQGGCERILKTPIPFNYAVHIKQFTMIYLLTMPFALVPSIGFLAVPMVLVIAFGLMGIEEAGVEVEDPFGTDYNDLPLESICSTIERDALAISQASQTQHEAPSPQPDNAIPTLP